MPAYAQLTTRYQTSAVIATAIDTLLCPMLTRNGYSAGHLTSFMNWRRDTKVVDLSIALPLEMRQEDTAQDVLDRWSHMKMHSLSPLPTPKKNATSVGSATIPLEESTDRRGEVFAQSLVFRGVSDRSNVRMGDPAHSSCNGDLLRDRIITIDKCRQTMCNLYTTAFPYAKPFPPLFSRRLGADGVVATPATWKVAESDDTAAEDRNADDYDTAPTQLRIATRLRNGTDIHTLIEREYVDQMRCIRAGQLWEFSDKGEMMSADDLVALRESLMSLSDAYSERDREW